MKLAGILATAVLLAAVCASQAAARRSRSRPSRSPGRAAATTRIAAVSVHSGGSGSDAFFVFEPARPRPERAPLAIVMHGYFEYSGYDQMSALIRHTVRKGNVVIYPRWQTGASSPARARSTSSRA